MYHTGNRLLHAINSRVPNERRVDIENFTGQRAYAEFAAFSVGPEVGNFILHAQCLK